eukprot:CAMPEP_0181315912 /NCGR_PEP_ID=MMETSP1101-20121128/15621_1 /TAXON_ID=46948 /ORGANISM="Rhodomonas abbreviata, Strain Caron Lab Isolate" /LENGTH=331 /DNA_ID=CAMNT_0023423137 /DNA_START=47 /DNA_END=1042 /DNA_ORIENTATION=-
MPKKNKNAAPPPPPNPEDEFPGVDKDKVYEKFLHYDADGNNKLDSKEILSLSVDLHHAFNPGKPELTPAQIAEVSAKLMERMDEKHGDHDGMLSFEEFFPWYELAAKKHWMMLHGHHVEKGENTVSTPMGALSTEEEPVKRVVKKDAPKAQRSAPPPPGALKSAPPPPPGEDVRYPGGFTASTTVFPSDAPEKLADGSFRVSSLDQALKVLSDNNAKVLIARRLDLKDEGSAKLAEGLKKNKCLEEIYLSQNNIGAPGAKALAAAVAVHPTLRELYMGYNVYGDAGAADLVAGGAKCKTLKTLDIDCAGIKNSAPKPTDGNIEAVCDFFNE